MCISVRQTENGVLFKARHHNDATHFLGSRKTAIQRGLEGAPYIQDAYETVCEA
jgi:hypothetical protein